MYKKGLLSLLLTLAATQTPFAADWSHIRSGGHSYVDNGQEIGTILFFHAKSGETLSLNHVDGPTTLFCAYSSIDHPYQFLGDQVLEPGESMTLRPKSTNLYLTTCIQQSGVPGGNTLAVLKGSTSSKKMKTNSTHSDFKLLEGERDILLEELHEYVDRNTK